MFVCLGGGLCLAGWWLSKSRQSSKHFAPQHAPALPFPPISSTTPPARVPPPRSEERAAGWPGFYLLLCVRCCAPASLAAPLHDGRLRSLVQSQWLPAVSHSSSKKFSGCLRLCLTAALEERVREAKGKEGKGGRNTIKMSCIPTDQSLPTSHVLQLTWLPDKWRLEERRRWKRY